MVGLTRLPSGRASCQREPAHAERTQTQQTDFTPKHESHRRTGPTTHLNRLAQPAQPGRLWCRQGATQLGKARIRGRLACQRESTNEQKNSPWSRVTCRPKANQ
ncbi:hypothetical protein [Spirosoma aerolatum]|uniref:hypothetical protein n=1 Tax=Spirosoma aerolatum TaxID=1211326 RepID=UPI0009AC68E8|nr:hypothetical protein [Spirosoma aerolatum]